MIIRIILLSFFLTLYLIPIVGQDLLTIEGESSQEVRIIEIGKVYISYKLWGTEEPLYRIIKSKVSKIELDESTDILLTDSKPFFNEIKLSHTYISHIQKHPDKRGYLVDARHVKSFWQLGDFMKNHQDAAPLFNRAQSHRKAANILGFSAIGTFIGGTALVISDPFFDTRFVLGVIAIIFATPILGSTGIGFKISSNSKKNQAIDAYGISYNQNIKVIPDSYLVNLGFTSNGLGLVVSF